MNFGELKTEIITRGKRPDLTSRAARYVSQCEGMIIRQVRAREMIIRGSIVEADRVANGIYNLPPAFIEERVLRRADGVELEKRALRQLSYFATSGNVHSFAILGGDAAVTGTTGGEIEFRAVPSTDDELEIIYFGLLKFDDDADEHSLLTNHEDLYIQGGLAFLYQDAHELELAESALGVFAAIKDDLNAQAARYFGGTTVANNQYHFGPAPLGGRGY